MTEVQKVVRRAVKAARYAHAADSVLLEVFKQARLRNERDRLRRSMEGDS